MLVGRRSILTRRRLHGNSHPSVYDPSTDNANEDYCFFMNLLSQLNQNKPYTIDYDLRSAVAMVFRFVPKKQTGHISMAPTNGSYINDADHKLRSMRHSGQLEVLIVRRPENIRADKLGCSVAFPGGLRPDVCPSDDLISVSINECRADIGLDLGDEAVFRAIGRLDDRYVQPEDGEPFVISPFVFLQIAPCHQQVCNRARWIPVNRLREVMFKNPQFVPMRINSKAVCPSLVLSLEEDEAASAPERIWGLTLESLVECFNLVNFIYLKPKL